MKVAVSGSSGMVGRPLANALADHGHKVLRLVRREAGAPDEIRFDPEAGSVDAEALRGADALVHLGGHNIAAGRWNAAIGVVVFPDVRRRGTSTAITLSTGRMAARPS